MQCGLEFFGYKKLGDSVGVTANIVEGAGLGFAGGEGPGAVLGMSCRPGCWSNDSLNDVHRCIRTS